MCSENTDGKLDQILLINFQLNCLYFLLSVILSLYVYSWISLSRSLQDRCKISSYPKFNIREVRD
jgi:hypothetical protein